MDGQHSYAVDLFWLRGGVVHQWFLRQTEEEDAALNCSVPLRPRGQTAADLEDASAAGGFLRQYLDLLREPRTADGARPIAFTWTGQETKLALRSFLNPVAGSQVMFARAPRLRPTEQKAASRDDFPGWHLTRSRSVTPQQTTAFGAIYEAVLPEARPRVVSVQWLRPRPLDDGAAAIAVTLASGQRDLIYVSTDQIARTVNWSAYGNVPVRVAGQLVVLRQQDRSPAWVYLWGQGQVDAGAFSVTGETDYQSDVQAVTRDPVNGLYTLDLATPLATQTDLAGRWVSLVLGDGESRGLAIRQDELLSSGSGMRLQLHHDPAVELTDNGAGRVHHPARQVNGPVQVRMEWPTFRLLSPDQPERVDADE